MRIARRRLLLVALGWTAVAGCSSSLRDHPLFSHFHSRSSTIVGESYTEGEIVESGPIIPGQETLSPLQAPLEAAPPGELAPPPRLSPPAQPMAKPSAAPPGGEE